MKSIRLIFKHQKSAKEYNASIEQVGDGYVVNFAYGKLNQSLRTGTKTSTPVALEQAEKVFTKLIKSKVSKGYIEEANGNSGGINVIAKPSGEVILPVQLSNPVSMQEIAELLKSKRYAGQVKKDGERRVLIFKDGKVRGLNRRGIEVAISPKLRDAMSTFCKDMCYDSLTLDGEDLGYFFAFDVLEMNGNDLRGVHCYQRLNVLHDLKKDLNDLAHPMPSTLMTFANTSVIQSMDELNTLLEATQSEEGIVLKDLDALYTAGRPNSLGDSLKMKNWHDLSALVTEINGTKRSVTLGVYQDDALVDIGNLTIPANQDIPSVSDVIDVKYLWVVEQGGSLIQPSFMRNRTGEILPEECVASQIVYKQAS